MQCKDIPDRPILHYLSQATNGQWTCLWYRHFEKTNPDIRDVAYAFPLKTHPKLMLGKMRMLLRRGLVDGCPCGCRGDWVITKKGLANLITQQS